MHYIKLVSIACCLLLTICNYAAEECFCHKQIRKRKGTEVANKQPTKNGQMNSHDNQLELICKNGIQYTQQEQRTFAQYFLKSANTRSIASTLVTCRQKPESNAIIIKCLEERMGL